MNLSSPFIRKPVMTSLVMAAFLIAGIACYMQLPVSNMPDVAYPFINVDVPYPGANADEMANNIATPLEREFLTISGLLQVLSNNTPGDTNIILQFDLSKDINVAALDVQTAITRALPFLPADLPSAPSFRKVNPAQEPILLYTLTSDTMPSGEMYDYANTIIAQRFALINGVADVQLYGSPSAVRVQVDPRLMAIQNVSLDDISRTVIQANPYLPSGRLEGPNKALTVNTSGQLRKAKFYEDLVIKYQRGAFLRIRDVGKAIDSQEDYKTVWTYFTKDSKLPSVSIVIRPQPSANVVQISKDANKYLPSIIAELPPTLTLNAFHDRSISISDSIRDVQLNLVIAFFLVVLIIFFYLGKPVETLIPALVLPLSVVGTFIFMKMFNYSLDNLSLLALILSLGFIIDDAIVVIENIVRRVEAGESPWKASLEGSKRIGFTILSMTLSLVAVFIPILFMSGLFGRVLSEFAVTLTIITLLSGFISLTLTPMLCSFFIHPRSEQEEKKRLHFGDRVNNFMVGYYKPSLKWVLKHRWVSIALFLICTLYSLYLFIVLKKDFMPDEDIGYFVVYSQAAQGTSPDRMREYQKHVTDIFEKDPNIGRFLSVAPYKGYRNGRSFVSLKPLSQRKPMKQVISELSRQTSQIVGLSTVYKVIPMIDLSVGNVVKGAYQYKMQSLHPEDLFPAAKEFERRMKAMPELQGVSSDLEVDTPQLFVNVLRDKAYVVGISAENIERTLDLAFSGGKISRIYTPANIYNVIVEVLPSLQKDPTALDLLEVRSNITNELVQLSSVAEWKVGLGSDSVNHINQFPSVTISFNIDPNFSLEDVLKQLQKMNTEVLPESVKGEVIGTAQIFEESLQSAGILLLVMILVIYLVLGILYESYIHPITILTTLPPAILGGLLTLELTGYSLSLYSFLGIILLIGIVKKNGIILIDYALENIREKGTSPEESIYDACIVRFRPIMMTTLTAIAGALPIAIGIGAGAEARRPLGLVIIGGLMLSQLITLFITPVLYLSLEKLNKKLTIQSADKE